MYRIALVEDEKYNADRFCAILKDYSQKENVEFQIQWYRDALTFLEEYTEGLDIVFMDPPYDKELERRVLEYLTMSKLIHEDTLIIFEASLDTDISYLEDLGYELIKEKKYKTNKHVFVQRSKR